MSTEYIVHAQGILGKAHRRENNLQTQETESHHNSLSQAKQTYVSEK